MIFQTSWPAQRRSYVHDASDPLFRRTASLCLRFALCVTSQKNATFFGGGSLRTRAGAMTSKFELGRDFCTMYLPTKVSSSDVYSFGSYRVDKQTNRQTSLKTFNVLRYATTLGNYSLFTINLLSLVIHPQTTHYSKHTPKYYNSYRAMHQRGIRHIAVVILSVCPSVTRVLCDKTKQCTADILRSRAGQWQVIS